MCCNAPHSHNVTDESLEAIRNMRVLETLNVAGMYERGNVTLAALERLGVHTIGTIHNSAVHTENEDRSVSSTDSFDSVF